MRKIIYLYVYDNIDKYYNSAGNRTCKSNYQIIF